MAEIELGSADAGQTRTAAEGDEIVVALDETPTSGYRWSVDSFDSAVLESVDDVYDAPEPGRVGGAGSHRFRFRVIGSGTSPIRLGLARAWDADSTSETYETTIDAGPAPTG
jgi:inhibitor of cysteine peptidase